MSQIVKSPVLNIFTITYCLLNISLKYYVRFYIESSNALQLNAAQTLEQYLRTSEHSL